MVNVKENCYPLDCSV